MDFIPLYICICKLINNDQPNMKGNKMSKQTNTAEVVVAKATKKALAKFDDMPSNLNVSQTIRWLTGKGLVRGDVVRYFEQHLGRTIRYQHVRNVLITPVKKA
jgi:hypothetical protein